MHRSLLAAVFTAVFLTAAAACGGSSAPAGTGLTPVATPDVPGALDLSTVGSATAIATARQHLQANASRVGTIERPGEPIARLISLEQVQAWGTGRTAVRDDYPAAGPDTTVWVVQFYGQWAPPANAMGSASGRFGVVAVDSHSGDVLAAAVSADPFISPSRLRATEPFSCVFWEPADVLVTLDAADAIRAVEDAAPSGAMSSLRTEWDFDRGDAQTARCVVKVAGRDTFAFRWFVTVPSKLELRDCSTPSVSPGDLRQTCWSPIGTYLVDGVDGSIVKHAEVKFTGPLLARSDLDGVQAFAGTSGWWETWARLGTFGGTIVPVSTLSAILSGQ